ncbi:GATA transcription factor 26 [Platanthera guangdongensis]|uniref:GATA transcription factor 26 n=1 Tax=Platanthera guangdongensis TaxID=2320717 RepID=A0ABR2LPV2_9ASPA
MGKHGPCRHCGVTSTPLWRNGPPEKPVLCNACGSRWRTKGSLVNYTPLHAREPFEWEEPKITKSKNLHFKNTEQKLQKRKRMVENVCEMPFSESGQNYIRTFEGDFSNRSSSGSAISYSESCANFGVVDASDWTGSAQSNTCVPLLPVPSKKRTIINFKPSPVEKLTKDLYSIWHEQQSSNLSGSLEEELLFEGEMPMGSAEIGHGGVLLRYPSSKATEEESEASSLPADNKLVGGPSSILVDSESRRTSLSNSSIDKFKNFMGNVAQDHATRDRFSAECLDMLQKRESLLRFTDLKDIINLEVFMKHLKNDEQQQLLKYLPSIDTANPPESIGNMFSSPQFLENLSYYQQHLQNGIFDLSSSQMNAEENRNLKRLLLLNFTKSRWVEHYNEMKDTTHKQSTGLNKGDRTNFLRHSNLKPIKRSHECQYQQSEESKGTMRSPKRVCRSNITKHSLTKSSLLLPNQSESLEFADTESFLDNGGTCFSPRSLFAPLPDRSSLLQFTDDSSDQSVLLDVRCSAPFPEAELLYHHPWDQKAASNNSHAESCANAEEESLCSFPDSSFAGENLNQTA